jgi:hypothetical protein
MTTTSFNVQNEGSLTFRPPFFKGSDYSYWKVRMIIYFQSIDYDLWLSIENGPHNLSKIKNGVIIPKVRSKYANVDKKFLSMDVKAMNILYCVLSRSEFKNIILEKY